MNWAAFVFPYATLASSEHLLFLNTLHRTAWLSRIEVSGYWLKFRLQATLIIPILPSPFGMEIDWNFRSQAYGNRLKFSIAGYFDNPNFTVTVWSSGLWSRVEIASTKAFLFTSSLYNSDRIVVEHNCNKSVSSSFEKFTSRQQTRAYSFISAGTFQGYFIDSSSSLIIVTADHYLRTLIDWRFVVLLR
jgi:hypothetical protein